MTKEYFWGDPPIYKNLKKHMDTYLNNNQNKPRIVLKNTAN